jgi:hypothetical protein
MAHSKDKDMMRVRGVAAVIGLLIANAVHAAAPSLEGVWTLVRPQTLLTPADQKAIPFTDQGREQYEQNKALAAKGDYSFDATMSRCSSPGLPRLMLSPEPFKIIQRPEIVAITFKWNHLLRQINLRQGPPLIRASDEDALPTTQGTTKAHWEGSTLVTHSTNFSSNKLLDNLLPSGDELELTEHIQLRDKNTLIDRITISDPENFTRPWDVVLTYKRLAEDTFPFAEDVCLDRKDAGQSPWPH